MSLTTSQVRTKTLPVAIIDSYKRDIRLAVLGTSHGEIVEAFLGNEVETVGFDMNKYDVRDLEDSWQQFTLTLRELLESVKDGLKVSALNLSSGFSVPIDFLGQVFGMKLNRFNLGENRESIKEKLFDLPSQSKKVEEKVKKPYFKRKIARQRNVNAASIKEELKEFLKVLSRSKTLIEMIELIEGLKKLGIEIFISAGNNGPNMVNLLGLANDIYLVGSGNSRKAEPYSCDNDLVNAYELGTFWLAKKRINESEYTLRINHEGCKEIPCDSCNFLEGCIQSRLN